MSFAECEAFDFFTVESTRDNIILNKVILGLKEGKLLLYENNESQNNFKIKFMIHLDGCYMRKFEKER